MELFFEVNSSGEVVLTHVTTCNGINLTVPEQFDQMWWMQPKKPPKQQIEKINWKVEGF